MKNTASRNKYINLLCLSHFYLVCSLTLQIHLLNLDSNDRIYNSSQHGNYFTGGTGKTSIRIARLLDIAKIESLLLSRKGESLATSGMSTEKFDWMDESTFSIPFQHKFENDKITAIYLVAPEVSDFHPKMNAFIDLAVHHGVKRFVILASTTMRKGSPHHVGPVWQHLDGIGVEYSILKPTWFMGKFAHL